MSGFNFKSRIPILGKRKVTLPEPRCPYCEARMEMCQLTFFEHPHKPGLHVWHESWGCDSCHTIHTFPARLEMLEYLRGTQQVPSSAHTIYLPK